MKLPSALATLVLLLAAGCSKQDAAAPADGHAGHGHAHQPLMGGQLVELGEHQANLEFKYDPVRGMLQAWVLDGHAENYVRVTMAFFEVQEKGGQQRLITLRARANELTGEKPGDTSAFEGEAPWLGGIEHFDGVVKAVQVRGAVYRDVEFHLHPRG